MNTKVKTLCMLLLLLVLFFLVQRHKILMLPLFAVLSSDDVNHILCKVFYMLYQSTKTTQLFPERIRNLQTVIFIHDCNP